MRLRWLCMLFLAVALASTRASAENNTSWVSGVGDDANPCSRTAPCSTLAGALAQTAAGGEVDILDPVDLGASDGGVTTITQSVTVQAVTQNGMAFTTTGTPLVIDAPGATVVLRGLSLNGAGRETSPPSQSPIVSFESGSSLILDNCVLDEGTQDGLDFTPATSGGTLYVRGGRFSKNAGIGINIGSRDGSPVSAMIERAHIDTNANGISVGAGVSLTVYDSEISFNGGAGLDQSIIGGTSSANLEYTTIASNGIGLDSFTGDGSPAAIRLSNVILDGNTYPTFLSGTGSVLTFGNDSVVWPAGVTCQSGYVTLSPGSIPTSALVGTSYSPVTFGAYGAFGQVSIKEQGALPNGLSLVDGVLTGTFLQKGVFPLTFSATDSNSCSNSFSTTLTVSCPTAALLPPLLTAATTGTAYPVSFSTIGTTGTVTYALYGQLPTGLSFSNGSISGYPTQAGVFDFTVIATDIAACTVSQSYELDVDLSPNYKITSLGLGSSNLEPASGTNILLTATLSNASSPTGSVTFNDGATVLGSGVVSNGVATLTTALHGVGGHSLTATYSGDKNNSTSTGSLSVTVEPATTSLTVITPGVSTYGETVTLEVIATSSDTIPVGTVDILEGSTLLGSPTFSDSGVATLQVSTLGAGSHTINASYGGDANNAPATDSASLEISQAVSEVSLKSSGNTTYGSPVTLTATVTSVEGGDPLEGTVKFFDGDVKIGSLSAGSDGVAALVTSTLAAGTHTFTATYQGSTDYAESTSGVVTVVVSNAVTTTSLNAPVSAAFGAQVEMNATVTSSAGTPSGSVTFHDGATTLGTVTLASGAATLKTSSLAAGAHSLSVTYSGSTDFGASSSAVHTLTVNAANTTTKLSAPTTAVYGAAVTLTATVTSSSGTPAGTVTFLDGTTTLGFETLSAGSATLTLASLTTGKHTLSASYTASTNFAASTSAKHTLTVTAAGTATKLSAPTTVVYGTAVTLTATVTSSGGTPAGVVTFLDGTTTLATENLSAGTATLVLSSLSGGTHSLTAEYVATADFAASTSATHALTVNAAATTTTFAAAATVAYGVGVTLTATVTSSAGTPTGVVTFLNGTVTIGTATLDGTGTASLVTSFTSSKTSVTLSASYAGNADFQASKSGTTTAKIDDVPTETTLTESGSPTVSSTLTLTAAVTANAGKATGTVNFKDGSKKLGSVKLSDGAATLGVTATAGTHHFTADYAGNATFSASKSAALTVKVTER